jgi:hypothetical protein
LRLLKSKVGGFVPGFSITIGPLIGEISMNIEIANRLVELRKKSGLSQEELAAKPADGSDGGAKAASGSSQEEKKEGASTASSSSSYKEKRGWRKGHHRQDGHPMFPPVPIPCISRPRTFKRVPQTTLLGRQISIFTKDCSPKEEKRRHRYHVAQEITSSLVSLLAVVAYVLLGCLYPDPYIGWGVCWLVFLAIPLATSFVEALAKRRFSVFAFPVLVAGLYAMVGMVFHLWHPTWVMFLAIPLYYAIFGPH